MSSNTYEVIDVPDEAEPPEFINLSDEEDDDVTLLAIKEDTRDLIKESHHKITKKLSDIECPICFDEVKRATATSCGHIFCLDCIQKSVSSSTARGQGRGRSGTGLCPLCRKPVVFKDTVVIRTRKNFAKVVPPQDRGSGSDEAEDSDGDNGTSARMKEEPNE